MSRGGERERERRTDIVLSCSVCGSRNYKTTRAPATEGQLSLKKFCKTCNTHVLHIESR